MAAYEKALELDPNCSKAIKGYKNCSIQSYSDLEETKKRAVNDLEVQQILNDPAMRMILQQMQRNLQAIQVWLKCMWQTKGGTNAPMRWQNVNL